ncbi:Sperm-associated antigen 8, partial [Quaeritorhiza haematococci]
MPQHGSDWNQHNGVGATLVENWVEERAVEGYVVEERKDRVRVGKVGHKDILKFSKHGKLLDHTTHKDAFKISEPDPRINSIGKRRQMIEEELRKLTMETLKEPAPDRSAKDWASTVQADFSHSDIYPEVKDLGMEPPPEEQRKKYAAPITFWTDQAAKNNGTVMCSTDAKVLPDKVATGGKFGRHADFTTPVQEYVKGPTKV